MHDISYQIYINFTFLKVQAKQYFNFMNIFYLDLVL